MSSLMCPPDSAQSSCSAPGSAIAVGPASNVNPSRSQK